MSRWQGFKVAKQQKEKASANAGAFRFHLATSATSKLLETLHLALAAPLLVLVLRRVVHRLDQEAA